MVKITPQVRNLLLILFFIGYNFTLNANNLIPNISSLEIGDNTSLVLYGKEELDLNFKNSFSDRLLHKLETYSLKKEFSERFSKIELAVVENTVNRTTRSESNYSFNLFVKPSITLGEISAICKGTTTAILPYSATANSPNKYSILFSTNDKNLGFKDISAKSHPFTSGAGSITIVIPPSAPFGTYTATFFVSNAAKGDDRTITIRIEDSQKPTISAPAAASGTTNVACTSTNVNLGSPIISDNCTAKANLTVTNNAPSAFPIGNTTVTWTVKDEANNTATATQIVTVTDNINPTITAPANASGTTNVACTSTNVNLGSPAVADNCTAKANLTVTNNAPSAFPIGNTTVTWTVKDAANNTATATQLVTITDNINPTITAPADKTVNADTNKCTASGVSLGTPTTADNCGVKSVTNDAPATFPLGETTITWTVTDNSDNTQTATQKVLVEDTQKPTITAPAEKTVNADTNKCTAYGVSLGSPTTTDNCGVKSVTNDAPATFPLGETVITWTVTDNSDNTQTATQKVIVEDTQKPTITAPVDQTINADTNKCTASGVNLGTPTTADNCGVKSVTNNAPATFPLGETTITWTVTDNSDNTQTVTQKVIVEDTQKPTITAPADKTVNADTNKCTASGVSLGTPTTADNCGVKSVTNDAPATFPLGETTITWTVTDNSDNTQTATQKVIVEDKQAPSTPTLSNIENWSCGKEITNFPTTTDNCSGEITGTTTDPLVYEGFGEYIITWIFTDNANNSTTANQTVIIPEPTVNTPSINGNAYCNEEQIDAIEFTGNSLENKHYDWSYKERKIVNGDTIYQNTKIGLNLSGSGDIPKFTAKNNTSEPITAVFTVIPFGNDCQGEPVEFSFTINPTPTITKPENITLCAGKEISFSNFVPSVQGAKFTVESSNTDIQFTTNNRGNITGINYDTNIEATINTIVTVTPEKDCIGPAETFNVTINPRPRFEYDENDFTFCNGVLTNPISFENEIPFGKITYDITGGSSIGISNKSGVTQISSFTPVNNGTTTIIKNIIVTPKANGCAGEPIEIPVKVMPSPIVNASFTKNICSGEVTDITLTSPVANTEFTWTLEAPAGIEGASGSSGSNDSIIQELINTTSTAQVVTYKVTSTANGCPGTTIPVKITVNPTPTFEVTVPECVLSVNLTDPSIKNNSNLTYTYWTDENANIALTNPNEVSIGTYYIKGTSDAGCALVKEVVVDKIKPQLTSPLTVSEVCAGGVFEYEFESNIPVEKYYWKRPEIGGLTGSLSGEGNIQESFTNTTNETMDVQFEIKIQAINGCIAGEEEKIILTVPILPKPQLEGDKTFERCSTAPFTSNNYTNVSGANLAWEIVLQDGISASKTSGSGSVQTTLTNNTANPKDVEFIYTMNYKNCEASKESIFVTVKPAPLVDATVSMSNQTQSDAVDEIEICHPSSPADPNSINLYSNSSINFETGQNQLDLNLDGLNLWNTSQGKNWEERVNGSVAYTEFSSNCNFWDILFGNCPTVDVNFSSNDNSSFLLLDASGNTNSTLTLKSGSSFSTVGQEDVVLSFYHYFDNEYGQGHIEYKADGVSWRSLNSSLPFTSNIGSPGDFRYEEFTIPGNLENVRIRFRYEGGPRDRYWALNNIKVSGVGTAPPTITWTRSDDPNWGDEVEGKANLLPADIGPINQTTTFTATYTYEGIENGDNCNTGQNSVTVHVREPLKPQIVANYCYYEGVEGKETR